MVNEADEPSLASVDRCHKFVNKALGLLKNRLRVAAHINVNCQVIFVALRIINDFERRLTTGCEMMCGEVDSHRDFALDTVPRALSACDRHYRRNGGGRTACRSRLLPLRRSVVDNQPIHDHSRPDSRANQEKRSKEFESSTSSLGDDQSSLAEVLQWHRVSVSLGLLQGNSSGHVDPCPFASIPSASR
jgi:hypothetical protein